MRISISCLMQVFIFSIYISFGVQMTTKVLDYLMALESKVKVNMLKSVLLLVTQTPLATINGGCSYLTQWLFMLSRWQRMF